MFQTDINIFWKIFIPFVFTALLGTSGWAIIRVADLPKNYETVVNHNNDIDDLDEEIDKVEEKVDEMQSKILTQQENIESKIDEINKFLRDYFSKHSND